MLLTACRPTLVSNGNATARAPRRYADLLEQVVTEDGYVDYDRLADDRDKLDDYVAWLAEHGPPEGGNPTSHAHQAFWYNAYNALVLFAVLEHGRPASVRDVTGPSPGAGFFLLHDFQVGPDQVSLWEIEHERIRQRYLDERAHGVLNCASSSCPPLWAEPLRPGGLQNQLDAHMERWVGDPERGVRLEADGTLVANPIFDWFAEDFERWTGSAPLCEYLVQYAHGDVADALSAEDCQVTFFEYDWSLNHRPHDG